ncbi:MAG TPA: 4a-hydroxytetrahydrobiopterin dehydratase [Thermoplasmata archaeon]|nr:4a-hydroxytetrahydrobiopterin dehydratase [Thermoplasmata archaeon]
MTRRELLSETRLAERLKDIPRWTRRGAYLERSWTFEDFPPALAFINRVGEIAEAMNHHPDIHNSWNKVRLRLTTHDRGGLTALDFELAARIDAIE